MINMRIYNTFSNRVEDFKPLSPNEVRMYTCGPTVYSHPHIGNFRSFIMADLLKRTLKFKGYKVYHVMNITDVGHLVDDADEGEDKIEEAAKKQKKDPLEIANVYLDSFKKASSLMFIDPADKYPRATDHVKEMIAMIEALIKNGFAYVVNKNVYFDVTKFKSYGQLSGNTLDKLNAGARIEINPEKKNPQDFALWKHDEKHLQQWDSPWGKGFPGWHIECSAMSTKYLGDQFDIHTGGEDNIFPHHECEIAQSEGVSLKKSVQYWVHAHHLLVDGEKMSKSKNNFYTIQDLVEKGFSREAIRYALFSAHYRQNCNFTFEGLKASQQAIDRIKQFLFVIEDIIAKGDKADVSTKINDLSAKYLELFEEALSDDLNISAALASVFNYIKEINRSGQLNSNEALNVRNVIKKMDFVLAVLPSGTGEDIPEDIFNMAEARKAAKKNKEWQKADELRAQIDSKGFVIEDIPGGGFRIKKKS